MWFEDKWMQLENIMLREVSQVQKDIGHKFSFICERQIQEINISQNKHDHTQTHT
jgi:hypothetical protein